MRLLYNAATVKASGNVDSEGLIGRAREDRRFGFRRANIFRRHQTDLASSSLHWAHNSGTTPSTSPSPFHARGDREGGVVTVTSRDIITQHI